MSDALVLSGGNIKGAYQAGAIEEIFLHYQPKIITGISVGALNTAFLAAYGHPLTPVVGHELTDFWLTKITSPKVLARKRNVLELAYRFLFKKWDGLVDLSRMEKLVRSELGDHFPMEETDELNASVGAVNLFTKELVYTDSHDEHFMDAVFASAAEPIIMPMRSIGGVGPFYDGGLRDITPLKRAIDQGATRIVMVLCQPALDAVDSFNQGDFMSDAEEVMGIVTNEILCNDIMTFTNVNELVKQYGNIDGKRYIPLTVIRPAQAINVHLTNFGPTDIKNMIEQGRQDAEAVLAGGLEVAA